MDILYVVGKGFSKCKNNELRYSLRSIEKYGKNIDKVYVSGYCPEFLSENVIKINYEQPYVSGKILPIIAKHANILATLLYAIDNSDISDEFLISMDDHIYISPVDFGNYPFYMKQTVVLPQVGLTTYNKFLSHTRQFLISQGLSYYNFCPHRNMHVSKSVIKEIRDTLNTIVNKPIPLESLAYIQNYRYTVYHDFKPVIIKDVKIKTDDELYKANTKITDVISTSDFTESSKINKFLDNLFKDKCKYEI